jgi:hypothetical protein
VLTAWSIWLEDAVERLLAILQNFGRLFKVCQEDRYLPKTAKWCSQEWQNLYTGTIFHL